MNQKLFYTLELDSVTLIVSYFLFAGLAYLIFYVWNSKKYYRLKIQKRVPSKKVVGREILFSISSLIIYSAVTWLGFYLWRAGYTTIYTDVSEHGWFYFIFSVVLLVLVHDAYFYWTHRLVHLPKLFPYIHRVHHQSVNPTPWAAYSFHPLEALISVGTIPIALFCFPVHPIAIFIFMTGMLLINVVGHLGYETFPERFRKSRFGSWHNTSSNHNFHHQNVDYNFGLYFTVWDRLMKTYRPSDPEKD